MLLEIVMLQDISNEQHISDQQPSQVVELQTPSYLRFHPLEDIFERFSEEEVVAPQCLEV